MGTQNSEIYERKKIQIEGVARQRTARWHRIATDLDLDCAPPADPAPEDWNALRDMLCREPETHEAGYFLELFREMI